MTKYINQIVHGNCLDIMRDIDDNTINLAITSPPYFVKKEYEHDWTWEKFDSLMKSVFGLIHDKLKPGGYFVINFGDNAFGRNLYETECISTYPMTHYYWNIKGELELQATRIWRKIFARVPFNGQAKVAPRNLFDYEHIWTFRKKSGDKKEKMRNIKLSCRGVLGDDWISKAMSNHKAAFPIELPLWALEVYSDDGDIVLDPFMGSGTTAIACIKMNRKFIGIELDDDYVKIARDRVENFDGK